MKRNNINQIIKKTIVFTILFAMLLTVGCGIEKGTTFEEQDRPQEDQAQDQADVDAESPGLINFKTMDIYGNDVNQDIFSDYKLTLVNVWGTFCGPCLDEMPDLGELQNEYEPEGVNIVGIVVDVQDEDMAVIDEQVELAKEIADTTDADYTHMIISLDMLELMNQFDAIPASFFVDSEGNIVSEYYIGSREKKDWVEIIETNLEAQQ